MMGEVRMPYSDGQHTPTPTYHTLKDGEKTPIRVRIDNIGNAYELFPNQGQSEGHEAQQFRMDGQCEIPSSEEVQSEELPNISSDSITQRWMEDSNKRALENMTKLEGQMKEQQNAIEEIKQIMAAMLTKEERGQAHNSPAQADKETSAQNRHTDDEESGTGNGAELDSVPDCGGPSNIHVKPGNGAKKSPQSTRTHVTRLEEYELEQFSSQEKNELVTRFKNKILASMKASPMATNAVWITLEKESLVICGEINDEAGNGRWPTEGEAREVVQAVLRQ